MSPRAKLLLVGAGNMGGALLKGWLHADGLMDAPNSAVLDLYMSEDVLELAARYGFSPVKELAEPGGWDAVIFAVKPQIMGEALPPLVPFLPQEAVYMSIAAGKTVESVAGFAPAGAAIVRTMPNLPASVGAGATGLYAATGVSAEKKALAERLMAAVGATVWVEDEAALDALTALSGSGPAYVFHLVEAMAEAGRAAGLDTEAAETLARATVAGAGKLMCQSGKSATKLREEVTSPGGTTAAALEVLMKDEGLARLMTDAVAAAAKRAEELQS